MTNRSAHDEDDLPAEEDNDALQTLSFHESLTWRAGKAIPVGDLLRRLRKLADELRQLDQEQCDRSSLLKPAQELASQNLLSHKDKGVRAWTAHCIADVFKLCAPDAPYNEGQMKDIFTLFINSILPSIADPQDPYHPQHLYVLASLATVKSIVLVTDIKASDKLIKRLFGVCFDILAVSSQELSRSVEYHVTSVLQCILEESSNIPTEVIELILAQFHHANPNVGIGHKAKKPSGHAKESTGQSKLTSFQTLPGSFLLAKNLCNVCSDRISRLVNQYFSTVLVDVGDSRAYANLKQRTGANKGTVSEEEEDEGPSEEELNQLSSTQLLLRELWRSCPDVVHNVVPQMDVLLATDNVEIRSLTTETIGDLVAGIGIAGPPDPPELNSAAFPPTSLLLDESDKPRDLGPLAPSSPLPFTRTHISTWQSYLGRRNDKSPIIRAQWTIGIGRILTTPATGKGLEPNTERMLLNYLSQMLVDSDERVRVAAIEAVKLFDLKTFVTKFSLVGESLESNKLLNNLIDRMKDRKTSVRAETMKTLAQLWAVGSGEISAGNQAVSRLLSPIPSKIFETYYVNDPEIHALIDQVLFECLVPVHYPTLNKKKEKASSQRNRNQNGNEAGESHATQDADRIRVERMLLVMKDLDARAKPVFLSLISRPMQLSQYMRTFLKRCEDNNGATASKKSSEIQDHLEKLIAHFAKTLPDPPKAQDDLRKFYESHDRRSYSLIRFCMASESDYRKVEKSIKELEKRAPNLSKSSQTMEGTIRQLTYKASYLFLNKSHIRPIIQFSQTNEKGLGSAAHDLIKHISAKHPNVFKTHSDDLCHSLESQAPTSKTPNDPTALDTLKACSTFAQRFGEGMPKERKFFQSMIQFALYGTPPKAAKHAVTILLSASDKKEKHASDLASNCVTGFEYGSANFLSRLACLSQLMLLDAQQLEDEADPVLDIAMSQILLRNRREPSGDDPAWEESVDDECEAKIWALKILVNRVRAYEGDERAAEIAKPVFKFLDNLVQRKGEMSNEEKVPAPHRTRLRLEAALEYLKLCKSREFDAMLKPPAFNALAMVSQDEQHQVRDIFVRRVKKMLGQDLLPSRFYSAIFLLAYEPSRRLTNDSTTWLRARAAVFARSKKILMEPLLARFLSLLAHHPDFSRDPNDLIGFIEYIMFYLKTTASEDNISLIYHVAQRVKSVQDAVYKSTDAKEVAKNPSNESLWALSELAQEVIRHFADIHNWPLEAPSAKAHLPAGVFAPLPSHAVSQEIANTQYLPEELVPQLESAVRTSMKGKKRKAEAEAGEDGQQPPSKRRNTAASDDKNGNSPFVSKTKSTSNNKRQTQLSVRKKPNAKASGSRRKRATGSDRSDDDDDAAPVSSSPAVPENERRRSRRTTSGGAQAAKKVRKSYTETADSDDDKLLEYLDDQDAKAKKTNGVKESSDDDELSDVPDDLDEEGDVHMGGDEDNQGSGKENKEREENENEEEDELAQSDLVGTPTRHRNNRQVTRNDSSPSASKKSAATSTPSKSKKPASTAAKPSTVASKSANNNTNAASSRGSRAAPASNAKKDTRKTSAEKPTRTTSARSTRSTRNAGKAAANDDGMLLPSESE